MGEYISRWMWSGFHLFLIELVKRILCFLHSAGPKRMGHDAVFCLWTLDANYSARSASITFVKLPLASSRPPLCSYGICQVGKNQLTGPL